MRIYPLTGLLTLLGGAIIALSLSSAAQAQTQTCEPFSDMVKQLNAKFDEWKLIDGSVGPQADAFVFVNPDTLSWTMIVRNKTTNLACVLAAGRNFRVFPASKPKGREM